MGAITQSRLKKHNAQYTSAKKRYLRQYPQLNKSRVLHLETIRGNSVVSATIFASHVV